MFCLKAAQGSQSYGANPNRCLTDTVSIPNALDRSLVQSFSAATRNIRSVCCGLRSAPSCLRLPMWLPLIKRFMRNSSASTGSSVRWTAIRLLCTGKIVYSISYLVIISLLIDIMTAAALGIYHPIKGLHIAIRGLAVSPHFWLLDHNGVPAHRHFPLASDSGICAISAEPPECQRCKYRHTDEYSGQSPDNSSRARSGSGGSQWAS
jgi:hypothetical protein